MSYIYGGATEKIKQKKNGNNPKETQLIDRITELKNDMFW